MEEDDILLKELYYKNMTWNEISNIMQERTANAARNRWIRINKFYKKPPKQRCMACGAVKRGHSCPGKIVLTFPFPYGDEVNVPDEYSIFGDKDFVLPGPGK